MRSIWHTLGLDGPTDDMRVIKKAYATQLKLNRPDDNPDGFMALREAFTLAKNYAVSQSVAADSFLAPVPSSQTATARPTDAETKPLPFSQQSLEGQKTRGNSDTSSMPPIIIDVEAPTPAPRISPVPTLISEITALMDNPFRRSNISSWRKIFDDDSLYAIDDVHDFEGAFLTFLCDYYEMSSKDSVRALAKANTKPISKPVGHFIRDYFDWNSPKSRPQSQEYQISFLCNQWGIGSAYQGPPIIVDMGEDCPIPAEPANFRQGGHYASYFVIIVIILVVVSKYISSFMKLFFPT